ncbi:MAG: hypothetical protein J3R72DRAFT_475300 [Linnemannia gamsii]|nr:MAG: hypothetical protein J3R72DRAFT_475300 [Linnemannia gamsii]
MGVIQWTSLVPASTQARDPTLFLPFSYKRNPKVKLRTVCTSVAKHRRLSIYKQADPISSFKPSISPTTQAPLDLRCRVYSVHLSGPSSALQPSESF